MLFDGMEDTGYPLTEKRVNLHEQVGLAIFLLHRLCQSAVTLLALLYSRDRNRHKTMGFLMCLNDL